MEPTITPIKSLSRYFPYSQFEEVFLERVKTFPPHSYSFSYLGSSVENRSIYGLKLGHGDFKVLAWSQMHGNESSTTRALLKLLASDDLFEILKDITLYIIPVLNPDGAEAWTRFNANNVDLNRDAIERSQPESQILFDVVEFFEPDLALNLHGQRTIYGVENSALPCQLSFLTPAAEETKSINNSRLVSMNLINTIMTDIGTTIQAAIGRYDDTFNGNCWGDYLQSLGIPTILFEAGHANDDYGRDQVTDHILNCLKCVLRNAVKEADLLNKDIANHYFRIPEVKKNYVDILIKNAESINGKSTIAIMYHEQVVDRVLVFIPMLYAINEASIEYGHRIIDMESVTDYQNDLIINGDMTVSSDSLKINSFIK